MKIRKNISLEDFILKKGQERAQKLFGGNFSIYLAYLIQQDCNGLDKEVVITKNEEQEEVEKLDEEVSESMNDILEM
ncbi:hypothetical protein [Clostridium perfringens]|uniref:hypothetical protein n=1 Tax=Clostridium perfringens TaxID=1502 RepID=UPI001A1CD404|nr:hypothetical protein [Clostridium perfringens]MBO3408114.1 hypothetical protein [Clostridium perfringens]HAT4295941.1 hypothetical protein [Clostridium perfringens]